MESCLAHTDTTCGEGAYQDPREDSPNPTHTCLWLGSPPPPKAHHIPDAPSSEESTDGDKPSKVPPPNCSHWGPRLQYHTRVWQGKGTASRSKCRETRVYSPRIRSRPSYCNTTQAMQVSILEKRKKFHLLPKVFVSQCSRSQYRCQLE